ncbi:universal stress protein [Natrialbaceae archaeon A-CW1-1]
MVDPHDHRILVPVDILGGQSVPASIVDAFASVPVVVLGYHEIPDQTTPEQAQSEFEAQARAELEKLQEVFETAGCAVTTRLVFTRDRFKTFERVALELDCDSILLLNPAPILERMLVAIRGDVNVDHVARLVATVLTDTDIDVTLLHVVSSDDERAKGEAALEMAASTLEENGIERDRIRTVVDDGKPTDAILDAAADHDLLVVGESRPSIRRLIFRDRADRIARRSVDPVIVVRGSYLESNGTDTGSTDER